MLSAFVLLFVDESLLEIQRFVREQNVMRPDSLPRLWRYINLLLTYLLT